jgi:hypothetical protein
MGRNSLVNGETLSRVGNERRGWKGGGQVAASVGLMVFNGEMLFSLDTAPRGGEPEGAWPGVKVGVAWDGTTSRGAGEQRGGDGVMG